jgi:hypothetical protein
VNPLGKTVRPKKKEYLALRRGMSYEWCCRQITKQEIRHFWLLMSIQGFSLRKEVIGRFAKKIEMSRKAIGVILTRGNLIDKSLESYCNECHIILGKLESFGIDYNNVSKLFGITGDDLDKSK